MTKRVRFAKGKHSATVSYGVICGGDICIFAAKAGQKMTVKITAGENNAVFDIEKCGGGYLEKAGESDERNIWTKTLPTSGDYKIGVSGTRGNATYRLSVTIR